jgi:serine/threonine protein kinase
MTLNIPNAGIPVDDYVYDNGSFYKLQNLHDKLTSLLKKGIIPMNKKNIYHTDIKGSNVLIDTETDDIKARLIDWGLTTEYIPFKNNPLPSSWTNRPFQFNVPFSVIMFTNDFREQYKEFVDNGGDANTYDSVKLFVTNYITFWNKKRGAGHYKFINEIFYALYSNDLTQVDKKKKPTIIETEFTMPTIVDYITHIVLRMDQKEYLDKVFIKNIDIWGFIHCYFPILKTLSNNYTTLDAEQKKLFESIKTLFINVYFTSYEPIKHSTLFDNLTEIQECLVTLTGTVSTDIDTSTELDVSTELDTPLDKGKGIQPKSKSTSNSILFRRVPKEGRFKNPIYLR